ncbi:protein translocase SecDF, variant type [Spiroplasma endosymbiont of Crioceris asparagi]|uniref:protein translocase SecDF, variant type n=1 Tax=Spiroplasma endosymbiont of Crioceris asparagi TaxID=3066286 RepID=UPI0030D32132
MKKRNWIFRLFIAIAIFACLVSGVFISASEIFNSAKLDSTFNGTYEALVSVNNINSKKTDGDNKPNGDSKEAAEILYKRLSPLGTNDITIEREGLNYLRVKTRASNYNNKTLFKNDIEKSGNVYILSKDSKDSQNKYSDLLFTKKRSLKDSQNAAEKSPLSDKISSATSSPIKSGTQKLPAITYNLKSGADFLFPAAPKPNDPSQLKAGPDGGDTNSAKISILSDADSLFNDIRNYFLLIRSDDISESKAISKYYTNVIDKLITIYETSSDDLEKNILYNLFHGTYIDKNDTSKQNPRKSASLMDKNFPKSVDSSLTFQEAFKKIADSWEFDIETTNFIYNTNSTADDFNKDEGKYKKAFSGYNLSAPSDKKEIGYVEEIFNTLLNTLVGNWFTTSKSSLEDSFVNRIENYFIFDGDIKKTGTSATSIKKGTGYVNGNSLVTGVGSYSTAKIGETIFNSSGKGYVFSVNSIYNNAPLISNTKFKVLIGCVAFVFLIIALYLLFAYRLLGLFVLVVALAITFGALAIGASWLSLFFGPETILATIILFALNTELSMLIINSMKKNIFIDKRGNRTSLNIAIKENAGLIMDVLACILLPSAILFWMSSSSLKTFAMVIMVGVLLAVMGQLLFMLLSKLIVSTDVFKKMPWLFIKNIKGNNQFEILFSIRKDNLINQKQKSISKKQLAKVEKIDSKIKKLDEIYEKNVAKKEATLVGKKIKFNEKLQNQLQVLKSKVSTEKNLKKISKLNDRIEVVEFAINPNAVNDGAYNKEVEELNIYELNNFKRKSSLTSKIIALAILILGIFAGIVIPLTGFVFDSSLSNGVSYIIFGNTKINEALNDSFRNLKSEKFNAKFNTELKNIEDQYKKDSADVNTEEKRYELDRETLQHILELSYFNKNYLESIIGDSVGYVESQVSFKSGDDFNYNGQNTNNESKIKQSWIEMYIPNISASDSHKIKKYFVLLNIDTSDENNNNPVNGGFISKKHIPSSSIKIIVNSLIAISVSVLILGVYIIVRFKWTYFIALALSTILFILITSAIIFGLHLPIGLFTIMAGWFLYLFFVSGIIISFAKFQSQILAKDESSLINHFKNEINEIIKLKSIKYGHKQNIKNQKNKFNSEVFDLKLERNNKISKDKEHKKSILKEYKQIIKAKKLALKKELKEYKLVSKSEYKTEKLQIQENIRKNERSNNYLLLIALNVLKENVNRFIFVISAYLFLFLLFAILLTPIWGFSLILILGTAIGWVVISFIGIPLLLKIEQSRIRRRLAFKRFINGIKVSGEEQIIEGIND